MSVHHLLFCRILGINRWLYTPSKELSELFGPDIPPEAQKLYSENMRKQSYEQGLGRHSESEINELGVFDLQAISHFLGNDSSGSRGAKGTMPPLLFCKKVVIKKMATVSSIDFMFVGQPLRSFWIGYCMKSMPPPSFYDTFKSCYPQIDY